MPTVKPTPKLAKTPTIAHYRPRIHIRCKADGNGVGDVTPLVLTALLPDFSPDDEVLKTMARVFRARGRHINTVGDLCEAVRGASPEEQISLAGAGVFGARVLSCAERVSHKQIVRSWSTSLAE